MTQLHVFAYTDDREEDRLLFQMAFKRVGLTNPLVLLDSGEQTQAYLQGLNQFADRAQYPLPQILFLDYKMPEMDGMQLVRWIRERPEFKKLVILFFSGSGQGEDIETAYAAGVNAYIVKPQGIFRLCTTLQTAHTFWCSIATPPARISEAS